jgi:diguanylate cyclase (GGDEF)-like protein
VEVSDADAAPVTLLLAGGDLSPLARELAPRVAETGGALEQVGSLLEAVFLAREPRVAGVPVIAAGVSQEIEQIEAATRALRKVYPEARIYLLCDPADEVRCRRCQAWGATDYLILPLDDAAVEELLSAARAQRYADGPSITTRHDHPATGFSLEAHTALLHDLANGQPDIAARAVALLQSHGMWEGTLRFVPADPGQAQILPPDQAGQWRAPVLSGTTLLGTLVLEGATADPQDALDSAAAFLASVLAVSRRYEQLRSLAITDELSGAYNRRYFTKFVSNLLDRARENRFRVTLLLFDIDDFKKYNDRFGHAAGDAIIRELIKLLRACTRPHDLVARVGGDEFAVVFWDNEAPRQPNSEHPRDAVAATERFRKAVQTHAWPATCNIQGDVSISGGLASFPWDADTLEELMARADEALLRAKAAGKNAILLHASSRCPD